MVDKMSRIALVGMSTTGKSNLGERCKNDKSGPLAGFEIIDSDNWVASKLLGDAGKPAIARVYLTLGREQGLKKIIDTEEEFLQEYTTKPAKAIFALGPGMGLRKNWVSFAKSVKLVLLEKSASEIYSGLVARRNDLLAKLKSNYPNLALDHFGCWDVDVMVDATLAELSEPDAIAAISRLMNVMLPPYQDATKIRCPNHPRRIEVTEFYGATGLLS